MPFIALLRTLDDAFVTNGIIDPYILVLVFVVACEKRWEMVNGDKNCDPSGKIK